MIRDELHGSVPDGAGDDPRSAMKPSPDPGPPATATPVSEQPCPECGAPVPKLHGYVSWCDACGWNVSPSVSDGLPPGRVERLYASAGRRLGDRLADRLIEADSLEPHLTAGRIAAFAIAVLVFAGTIAMIVGGVLLAVLPFPNVFAILLGIAFVLTGIEMRPRLGKVPTEHVLARKEAPSLFALADGVASSLGTEPADVVALSDDYNASWAVLGFRRRRVLTLGLPLLAALEPQELVAVVAHELAHASNGDARRGLVVGSAVNGLGAVYALLSPRVFAGDLVDSAVNGLLWILRLPVWAVLSLEVHLLLRDSQRAEYYADALAARVAGSAAVVSLHEKLLLTGFVDGVARRVAIGRAQDVDVFGEISRAVAEVPPRERERRRRAARLEHARLDVTHPPTGLRIHLLEERPAAAGDIHLDAAGAAAIDGEVGRFKRPLQAQLLDAQRDRLYAR